jgi:hypothetical protein
MGHADPWQYDTNDRETLAQMAEWATEGRL